MRTNIILAVAALGLMSAPLSAQIRSRTDGRRTADGSVIRSDGTIIRPDGTVITPNGRIIRTSGGNVSRSSSKIPPGQLPPRGMCRVWIDGVPPGQQPPVTDCATARIESARTPNSHVIYGDEHSFPGRGKGKFKNRSASTTRNCSVWDQVVIGGRVQDVCRDSNGNIVRDRRTRDRDDDEFENEHEDGDDRLEHSNRGQGKSHAAKVKGKKHGRGDD
jgi:hypothetical protein